MKGSVWEMWIYGMVALFIAIVVYFAFTPFMTTLTNTAASTGNFTTQTINTSFHQTLTRNMNMWDFWPVVIGVVVLILIFIVASKDDEFKINREAI